MSIDKDTYFAGIGDDPFSYVYNIYPDIFTDPRGSFSEVLKTGGDAILNDISWIKQVNRSKSHCHVVRGMHAQRGNHCQAKLVEVITGYVYDVIVDARPDVNTFGRINIYRLDSLRQNKLFVPRGFLHGFVVPEQACDHVTFNYLCDNTYDKQSEITINPKTVVPKLAEYTIAGSELDSIIYASNVSDALYSDKDLSGMDYDMFMDDVKKEYETTGKVWYRVDSHDSM